MTKLEYTFKTDILFKMLFVEYPELLKRLVAKTTEELEKIKALEVPVMSQAIEAYYTITASSEFRERERLRTKARHDEAQALYNAEQKARIEFAQKLLKRNRPIEEIIEDTGLTQDEIERLRG